MTSHRIRNLIRFISEARISAVIAGNLKRIPLLRKILPRKTGGSINARYCYSVWLRHLYFLSRFNGEKVPVRVAELGPGDSLGIGLAAILSGSERYYALDIIKYWDPSRNISMLEDLLLLFNSKAKIPDNKEFPNISPVPGDYRFPSEILTEGILKQSLEPSRIEKIRNELCRRDDNENTMIKFKIPWSSSEAIEAGSVDLIFSQAVLQHVDDLETTYSSMKDWLDTEGLISHTVSFRSHGLTRSWNGYWTISDTLWNIIRGGRIYAINRFPLSKHRKLLEKNGFSILFEKICTNSNRFKRSDLAKKYQKLTDEDLITSGVYYIARKLE